VVCELLEEDEELLATSVGMWERHSFSHSGCCSNSFIVIWGGVDVGG
jgi:hypothetical protein